ncbi:MULTISPECIES: DUF305 domain-containing protein [unclassified Pseudofrankia]|uniref:DUF305 domain-containing protein n=1 Tax=unclassified Pseudofrankia TaxID=2994372 RepID=UPI0008D93265|nr:MULTISPECIES: DUF305 domain-containing protein [unclassified Pseudofrankia]MDT3446919.1 DUF305 domain-containing protein [Pseudofrankia sp. BMG5.37]OHV73009.1 DUF305 domain-containing protein [Pseudofrankia sp. BMG5.36]
MKRLALLVGALLAAVVLAACGNDSGSTGTSASTNTATATSATGSDDHNSADVAFTQSMIMHHGQAVEMADLAPTRASSAEVKTLARQIRDAQAPEITMMTGWLTAWGQPTISSGSGMDMGAGHDMTVMPSHSMAGMMSEQDMSKLRAASGRDFDRMFLTMMIEHHRGAIEMATTEQRDGFYGPAKELAGSIVTSQTAEITTMEKLLENI